MTTAIDRKPKLRRRRPAFARFTVAFAAVAFAAAFAIAFDGTAAACMNATMDSDTSIRKLKAAERALDSGDVLTARELAEEVRQSLPYPGVERADGRIADRAIAIVALAHVRDRNATPAEIEEARQTLESWLRLPDEREREREHTPGASNPALAADLGEAEERAGHDADALATLTPLARKDLIGSAYAYAALGRAARRKGDTPLAALAEARCHTMAATPSVCDGVYPKAPLLRGGPIGYVLPLIILAAATLRRRSAEGGRRPAPRDRRRRRLRRSPTTPWSRHRTLVFTALAVLAAALAFSQGRSPWLSTMIAAAAAIGIAAFQRASYFAGVRAGRVPGFTIRPTAATDAHLPTLALTLAGAPAAPETLEHEPDPSYRGAARVPLLRLVRRRLVRRHLLMVWVFVGMLVMLVLTGAAALLFLRASVKRSPSIELAPVVAPEASSSVPPSPSRL